MRTIRTVVISGGTAYIGRNVARAFRRAGYRVLGITRGAYKAADMAADETVAVVGTPRAARGASDALAEALMLDQQVNAARAERELCWRRRHAGCIEEAATSSAAFRKTSVRPAAVPASRTARAA